MTSKSIIYKEEYEIQKPENRKPILNYSYIKKLINKIVLKDSSILLELSKVND